MKSGRRAKSGIKAEKASTTILSSLTDSQLVRSTTYPKTNRKNTKLPYNEPSEKQSEEVVEPTKVQNGDFDHFKLEAALLYAQDILERSQIPFVVLGDAAYQMRNNMPLQGHKIVLGVMERHAVKECTSLLTIIDPTIETLTDGYRLLYQGVPVFIKVLTKDYPTLLDPDIVFYSIETFRIPNPFELYWKGPHLDV